ncbi:DUF2523 family protein [Pseudoalteromonas xiamenensis]
MTKTTVTLFFILFAPLALADDYSTTLVGILKWGNDFLTDFWEMFDSDIPDMITRFFAWLIEYATLIKLKIEFETVKFSWQVAREIIENFQVGSRIASAASSLPKDVQAALVDMRAFDALNVVIQALTTRYVMRFF